MIVWHGEELELFDHPYNETFSNERAVELAIATRWLRDVTGSGLEVGNVLGHYGISGHRVVDLYEQAPGVENVDLFDVRGSFDWIVSVSTIEHVAWTPNAKVPGMASLALSHLRGCLAPAGRMLVTVPGGWNQPLDEHLATLDGVDACTYVRTDAGWELTDELTFRPYGASTPWADSVWIGTWG